MSESENDEQGRNGDVEKTPLTDGRMPTITTKDHTAQDPLARAKMFAWMFINTLATVFIVSRIHQLLLSCSGTSIITRDVVSFPSTTTTLPDLPV